MKKKFICYVYNDIKKKMNCKLYICVESVGRFIIIILLFYLLYFIINFITCATWLQIIIHTFVYGTFIVVASLIISEIIIKTFLFIMNYYNNTLEKIKCEEQINNILKDFGDKKEKFFNLFPELKNDNEIVSILNFLSKRESYIIIHTDLDVKTLFKRNIEFLSKHIESSNYKNKKAILKELKTFLTMVVRNEI